MGWGCRGREGSRNIVGNRGNVRRNGSRGERCGRTAVPVRRVSGTYTTVSRVGRSARRPAPHRCDAVRGRRRPRRTGFPTTCTWGGRRDLGPALGEDREDRKECPRTGGECRREEVRLAASAVHVHPVLLLRCVCVDDGLQDIDQAGDPAASGRHAAVMCAACSVLCSSWFAGADPGFGRAGKERRMVVWM